MGNAYDFDGYFVGMGLVQSVDGFVNDAKRATSDFTIELVILGLASIRRFHI
jgi:hypothetical protein